MMNRPIILLDDVRRGRQVSARPMRPRIELSTPATRIESLTDQLAEALASAAAFDRAVWSAESPTAAEAYAKAEREALERAKRLSALIKSNLAFLGKDGK